MTVVATNANHTIFNLPNHVDLTRFNGSIKKNTSLYTSFWLLLLGSLDGFGSAILKLSKKLTYRYAFEQNTF